MRMFHLSVSLLQTTSELTSLLQADQMEGQKPLLHQGGLGFVTDEGLVLPSEEKSQV